MGFAVDDAEASTNTMSNIAQSVASLTTMGFNFLSFLLYPLMLLISQLMDPDILIGPDMEAKLLEIWVQIRNWINMFFVLALVVIALYNVLGIAGDGSNYALKAILPKIVIGLIAVNFSFLAGKVLIDATNVLTNAVYALPTDLKEWDDQVKGVNERLCSKIVGWEEPNSEGYSAPKTNSLKIDDGKILSYIFCKPGEGTGAEGDTDIEFYTGKFNEFGDSFFNVFGAHNVDLVLMVNMGQVMDINIAQLSGKTAVDQFAALSMQTLFGILLFLLFGFAFVAVVVVMAARLVILWICLALSPFVVLLFVFPDLANLGGGGELNLKTTFFKHLFAPVMMGVVFSVGFVMLATLQGSQPGGWLGKIGEITFEDLGDADAMEGYVSGTFGRDISDFQDLLVAICAVVIIWVGVFAAASQTIASSWTQAIKGAGESVGKFLAESPLYATVIPVPGGKKDAKGNALETVSLGGALFGSIGKLKGLGAKRDQINKDDARKIWGAGTPIQDYADQVESRVKKGSKADIHAELKGLAAKKGSDGVENWVEMLGDSNVQKTLELEKILSADDYAKLDKAIEGKDTNALVRLLKTNPKIEKAIFGEGGFNSGDWDKKEVTNEDLGKSADSTEPVKPTEEEKAETQKKKEEGTKKLKAGKEAIMAATTAAAAATTVGQLDSTQKGAVQAALSQEELDAPSSEIINEMFTVHSPEEASQVKEAGKICKEKNAKIEDPIFNNVKINKDGTIDGASFVEAVNTAFQAQPKAGEAGKTSTAPTTTAVPGGPMKESSDTAGTPPPEPQPEETPPPEPPKKQ
ncbi:MAG: hypothetical protein WC882_00110 [Candidatus Gracilibacteria bacterium]